MINIEYISLKIYIIFFNYIIIIIFNGFTFKIHIYYY